MLQVYWVMDSYIFDLFRSQLLAARRCIKYKVGNSSVGQLWSHWWDQEYRLLLPMMAHYLCSAGDHMGMAPGLNNKAERLKMLVQGMPSRDRELRDLVCCSGGLRIGLSSLLIGLVGMLMRLLYVFIAGHGTCWKKYLYILNRCTAKTWVRADWDCWWHHSPLHFSNSNKGWAYGILQDWILLVNSRWKQHILGQPKVNWDVCCCVLMGFIEDQSVCYCKAMGGRFSLYLVGNLLLQCWVLYTAWAISVSCAGYNYMDCMRFCFGLVVHLYCWVSLSNWLPFQCLLTFDKSKGSAMLGGINKGYFGAGLGKVLVWEWRGADFGGAGGRIVVQEKLFSWAPVCTCGDWVWGYVILQF
ncbi:hypothetical protein E3N88_19741 [Mikania micrantha]|uniref:Uncharacterized protein n=1 Tax=Mikania micrantha TaxID=192012 RepID=A0A5N6NRH3_9ASTR|nr:hypothetical protein E3N88_19741 [Mikania micrantha]